MNPNSPSPQIPVRYVYGIRDTSLFEFTGFANIDEDRSRRAFAYSYLFVYIYSLEEAHGKPPEMYYTLICILYAFLYIKKWPRYLLAFMKDAMRMRMIPRIVFHMICSWRTIMAITGAIMGLMKKVKDPVVASECSMALKKQ